MNTLPTSDQISRDLIYALAARHGLELTSILNVNEVGLDFQVVTVTDPSGTPWILRIPRRADVTKKIQRESTVLALMREHLPFAVPDWRIVSDELVAYPKLNDPTAIHVDPVTGELVWNIDRNSDSFPSTLGRALAALHSIPPSKAQEAGLRTSSPQQIRTQLAQDIEKVGEVFTINPHLKRRWADWLNDDTSWPDFTVVVHGDLYAGHILVDSHDAVTAMIDWTEAEVSDCSIDFVSHLLLFGEAGLESLVKSYEAAGGRTWPRILHHIKERLTLTPLKYALFALESDDQVHLDAAKTQLLAH